jgi:two-component system nitrate/nitrite response regulator NarL
MRELIQISEPHARIQEAKSYDEAVDRIEAGPIDIAFLDIDLKGGRSGLRHSSSICGNGELDTRAIMLSGRSDKDVVRECLQEGASGYILKDLESDGLFRRALDTILQGSIFLPASVIGRGGFSPARPSEPSPVSPESLGITGRAREVLYWVCQGLLEQIDRPAHGHRGGNRPQGLSAEAVPHLQSGLADGADDRGVASGDPGSAAGAARGLGS